MSDPPIDLLYRNVWMLRQGGANAINLMGGEPTLREDLPEIVRYASEIGLKVILSTNALALTRERLDTMAPFLDWVSLSLDAGDRRLNDGLRGRGQFDAANRLISWVDESSYPFRLKMNTQVTALNIGALDTIPQLFRGAVDVWKLLQWTPRADAARVSGVYAVSSDAYSKIVHDLREKFPAIVLIERPYPEPDPDTVIVRPNGDMEVNAGLHDYEVIGNIEKGAGPLLAKAATLYARLPGENAHEFETSYPT